jgi:hypothetical protein
VQAQAGHLDTSSRDSFSLAFPIMIPQIEAGINNLT